MIKQVNEISTDIILSLCETDSEVIFRFHSKYMNILECILKPKTSGASISPYSNRNLPKNKAYKIPDEDLLPYRNMVRNIPKERILELTHKTNNFMKSLATKKCSFDSIKEDMKQVGLRGKEYIHSIGKWNEYIKFLGEEIQWKQ